MHPQIIISHEHIWALRKKMVRARGLQLGGFELLEELEDFLAGVRKVPTSPKLCNLTQAATLKVWAV